MDALFLGVCAAASLVGLVALATLAWSAWCEHQFTRFKATGWKLKRRDLERGSLFWADLDSEYCAYGRTVLATVRRANQTLDLAARLGAGDPISLRAVQNQRTREVWASQRRGSAA